MKEIVSMINAEVSADYRVAWLRRTYTCAGISYCNLGCSDTAMRMQCYCNPDCSVTASASR